MKKILLWIVALIVAIAAGFWFLQPRPQPVAPTEEVPIEDAVTIDFSSGKPVVKDGAAEKALIDAAVKDINDAAKNIKFAPLVPPKVEAPPPP